MATHPVQFRDGNPELRARAAELLARYPDIDEPELAELRRFYNTAPAIDTAILTCNSHLLSKIALFEGREGSTLRHEARLDLLLLVLMLSIALIAYGTWAGV